MIVIRKYLTGLLLLAGLIMAPLMLQAQKPLRYEIEAAAESCIKSFFEADGYLVTGVRPFGILDESSLWLAELDPCGWIIISGDKKSRAVLAFSETGEYTRGVEPADEMLSLYEVQIEYLRSKEELPPDESWVRSDYYGDIARSKAGVTVAPLIKVNWGQGAGWNQFCPVDAAGPGGHVYVGCVAVAMAQAMTVYGYPWSGREVHSYTHNMYGVQEVDFSAAYYNWDAMSRYAPDTINAKLLYHLAVSVNMNFGAKSSSASTSKTAKPLNSYFLYSGDAWYAKRTSYSSEEWISHMISELEEGRPLIYRGESADESSAHAFNIDGVKTGTWFHLNWGWGGNRNGYYTVDALTPGTRNYSYDHGMVLNLKPYYYPTAILLSGDIVPEDQSPGAFIASIEVVDEATDNQYEITVICDSAFIGGVWVLDYSVADNLLYTGRTFISGEETADTVLFLVSDNYGNKISAEQILRFGSASAVSDKMNDPAFSQLFYPNPASDEIYVTDFFRDKVDILSVYTLSGVRILTFGPDFSSALCIASLDAGIYILEAWLRDGRVVRKKVIKN